MNRCFELARLLESGGTRAATPVEIWSSTLPRFRAYRGFSSPALFRGATETSLHRTLEILERSAPRAAAVKAALELDADASAESFGRWMSRRRGKALWSLGNIPVIWIPDGPFERGALVELARDAMQTCESALMQVWTDGTSAREIGVDLDQVRAELFKTYDDVPGLTDILASCVSRRVEARRYAMSMLGTSLGILYMYVNTRGIHGLLSSIVALELESRVSGPTLATAEDLMNRYPQLKDLQYARDTWSLVVESDGWTLDRSAMNDPAR